MGLTQITTGGVDDNINIDSNTLKVDGTNNRVGIGTATPSHLVDARTASGNAQIHLRSGGDLAQLLLISNDTSGTSQINFGDNDANNVGLISYAHSNNSLRFTVNASERLRIDSSGRLLIGRTSTSHEHPLQIQAASGANAVAIAGRSADDQSEITFYENDNTTVLAQIQQISDRTVIRHRTGYLRFDTGGTTERMRIDSSGVVNVNTTTSSIGTRFNIHNGSM